MENREYRGAGVPKLRLEGNAKRRLTVLVTRSAIEGNAKRRLTVPVTRSAKSF